MRWRAHLFVGLTTSTLISTLLIQSGVTEFMGTTYIPSHLSLLGIGLSGVGALWVDSDILKSKINTYNPILRSSEYAGSMTIQLFMLLIRFVLGLSLLLTGIFFRDRWMPWANDLFPNVSGHATGGFVGILILLFITYQILFGGMVRYMPVIGSWYTRVEKELTLLLFRFEDMVRRLFNLTVAYVTYAYSSHTVASYCVVVFFIGTAIFPHRTFLHSIEGLILSYVSVGYFLSLFGCADIAIYFSLGYFSHIYLADALTQSGVPVLFTPILIDHLLKRVGVNLNHRNLWERLVNFRIRLYPHMTTGSPFGNTFELVYCLFLGALCLYVLYLSRASIVLRLC